MQNLDIAYDSIYNIPYRNSFKEIQEDIQLKKLLSILLCTVMIFSAAVPAIAADGEPTTNGTFDDYRFKIFGKEEAEAIAQEIAQMSWYEPLFLEPDTESVVISVNLRAYPQLSNLNVLIKASRAIVDRSPEFLTHTTERVELLSYSRFAGELVLHVMALTMLDRAVKLGFIEDPTTLYETFEIADMNLDEERISPVFIEAMGVIVMNILGVIY